MCGVPRLLIPNSIPTHLPDFNLRLISCLLKFLGKIQHKEALDGSVGPEEVTIYKLTVPKIDPEEMPYVNVFLHDLDKTETICLN